jgi:hypothetical protein
MIVARRPRTTTFIDCQLLRHIIVSATIYRKTNNKDREQLRRKRPRRLCIPKERFP